MGDQGSKSALTRREALKLSAGVVGATAFATPVVVGAFSAPALGQTTPLCTPENDSDAVLIKDAGGTRWNINCQTDEENPYGRYNSQRSEFGETEIGDLAIVFGWGKNTDNFATDKSWYTIETPEGWTCSATWKITLATKGSDGCNGPELISEPPPTAGPGDVVPSLDFSAEGAEPLPYCPFEEGTIDPKCDGQFLTLLELICCQVVDQ
jgi:hypothetical protein